MNLQAMRVHTLLCLRDADKTSSQWGSGNTFIHELINRGCRETAHRLPPEAVSILVKTKSVGSTSGTTEYSIDGAPFSLTDFMEARAVFLTDGTNLQPCHLVPPEYSTTTNPFYAGTKYNPGFWIAPKGATPAERALNFTAVTSTVADTGIKLIYTALPNVLSGDSDTSILPVQFHELPCWYAAALGYSKEHMEEQALSFWGRWRDAILAENARYGRSVEIPPPPTGRE